MELLNILWLINQSIFSVQKNIKEILSIFKLTGNFAIKKFNISDVLKSCVYIQLISFWLLFIFVISPSSSAEAYNRMTFQQPVEEFARPLYALLCSYQENTLNLSYQLYFSIWRLRTCQDASRSVNSYHSFLILLEPIISFNDVDNFKVYLR